MPVFIPKPTGLICVKVPTRDDDVEGWVAIQSFYEDVAEDYPGCPIMTITEAKAALTAGRWLCRPSGDGMSVQFDHDHLMSRYMQVSA